MSKIIGNTVGTSMNPRNFATTEQINQLSEAIVDHAVWYGESPTDRTQPTKIVNTTTGDFKLQKGARIFVKFLANTGMGNSLNVDGTGAVYVHAIHNDDEELEPEVIPPMWNNIGQIQAFTYDGMYFIADDCIRATADNGLFGKVGVSNSVTSDSGDTVASSNAVKAAYDKAVEALETKSGGMNATAKSLLITILRNGVYTTDQSANISALETALGEFGAEDDTDTGGVTQTGSALYITGGVTATQSGTALKIA